MADKNGRLLCKKCKKDNELILCNDCYLEMQGWALVNAMKEDPNIQIVDSLRQLRWDLEDKIKNVEIVLIKLINSLEDFKIRGLKLKSKKNKPLITEDVLNDMKTDTN